MALEERDQPHLHVVVRVTRLQVVEAAGPQRPPESLHLAARLRVVGSRVHDHDPESRADELQRRARVGRTVVEVERVGLAVLAQRRQQKLEHVDLALARACLERGQIARGVVEEPVDA